MAKQFDTDDVLSLIQDGTEDKGANRAPSSQQNLRDMMLRERQTQSAQQGLAEKEEELSEEIIDEEEEEEYGTEARSKKLPIIIGGIALLLVLGIIILLFSTRDTSIDMEQPTEEVPAEEIYIEPEVTVTEPVMLETYAYDQIQNLKAAGATQEQIDMWQKNGTPYEYVYYTMLDRFYGWQLTNTLPTYDLTSDAYKEIIGQTWMSLPERTDIVEWTTDNLAYMHSVQQNLDYEKVTPFGNQLFLKVYLDASTHDSWFFLCITPEQWNMLDDEGNVVVDYEYQTKWLPHESLIDQKEDTSEIFITNATLNIIESMANIENKNNSDTSSVIGE